MLNFSLTSANSALLEENLALIELILWIVKRFVRLGKAA